MSYTSHVTYTRVGQSLPSLVSGNFLWGSHGGSSSACTEWVLHLLSSPKEWPHHLPSLVSQKPGATYFSFSPYTCSINHWILSLLIPTCTLPVTASNSVQPPPSHPVGCCKAFSSTSISLLRTRSPLPPHPQCSMEDTHPVQSQRWMSQLEENVRNTSLHSPQPWFWELEGWRLVLGKAG